MRLLWSLRGLLAIASLAAFSKATIEIPYRIRLITANDDIGGGRIEVYHNGQWGTICDKSWSEQASKVACRELGFKTALYPSKRAFFGEGSGPIFLSNVKCTGDEHSLLECENDGFGVTGDCTHKNDAGVRCLKEDSPELDYLGCWIDNPNKRILSDLYSNRRKDINWYNIGETVLNCAKDAANSSKDYNLFAVQYFGECWSEEGNPDYKKMRGSPEGCQYGVGDLSHNAVYGFKPYFDLGCWNDKPGNGRTMVLLKSLRKHIDWYDLGKTVTACYNLAKQAGKKYFAVQFYGECWVSDDDLKYKKYSQATNCYQGVGANWSNYVYKIRA
ncbi:hypothetical protein ABFA07_000829 [Porites harrisoni]